MNENEQTIQDGTTTDYLNQLVTDRDNLADNLTAMGVPSEHIETFTELVPKVLQIPQGSGSNIQYITDNSDQNPFVWTENEPGIYAFYDETNQQLASSVYMQYDENANVQQMQFTGLLMLIDNTIDDPYVTGKQIGMVYNVSESKLIGIETAASPYNLTYSFAQGLENYVNTQFNQIIGGVKTFTSLPQSSGTPTNNDDLVNKSYVDSVASTIQYDTMPTASSTNVGDIIQYTGTTTQDYTNGYFYKCVSDGQDPATYSWQNINIQDTPTVTDAAHYVTEGTSSNPFVFANKEPGVYQLSRAKPYVKRGPSFSYDQIDTVDGKIIITQKINDSTPDGVYFATITSAYNGNDSMGQPQSFNTYRGTSRGFQSGNSGISNTTSYIVSSGNQKIWGVKTFYALPQSAVTPTNDKDFTTKSYVDNLVSLIPQFDIEVVQALPTQDISTTTVYLLTNSSSETGNLYDEYIYVNNAWEKLGSQTIDLNNYYTKTETNGLLDGKVTAYTTLPTASASNEGEIAQYLGADDGTYHKGYFYQVTSDGETPATYKWSECDVQSRPDLSGYYSKSEVDALVANNEIPFGIFDLTTSATSSDIVTAFGGSTAFDEIQEKLKTHKDATFVYKDNNDTVTTYPGRVLYTYRYNGAMRYIILDTVYSDKATGQIHRRYIKLQYLTDTWTVEDVQDDVITTQDDLENATSQFAILPVADASSLGRIVQYIGPTSGGYTQGYFYQVVSDGAQTPTYSWESINVQPTGGSSSGNVQYITQGSSQNPVILEDLDPGIYQTPYSEINIKRSSSSTATYIKSLDGRLTVLNKVDANTPDDTIILTYININDPDRGATGVVRKVSTFSAGIYGLSFGNFADIGFGAVTTGGNQTILGTKTFNILPKSSATPSSSDDFVTKIYVDSKSSGQTDTMPSPSSSIEGMVIQYIGVSDINYTNGYYYKCVEDTSTTPSSYKWVRVDVQPKHNRMPYTLNIIDSSNVQLENTGEVPMGTNNSYGVPVTTDTYFPGGTTVDITFYDTYISIQQNNYDGTSVGSLVGEVINGSKTYVLPEGYYYTIQLLKMPILGTLTSTFSAAELAAMPNACSIYLTNGDAAIKEKMLEAQMRNLVTGLSNPMNAGYKIDGKDVLVQRAKINEALDKYGIGYYVLSMSLPSGSSIEKIEGKCVDTTTGNILFFPCGIVYATYDAANDYIELNYNGTVSSYNNTYVNVYYTRT